MRSNRRLCIALICLIMAGCSPASLYVEADRSTYDVIAPAHLAYVQGDATLTPEQKARRVALLETWAQRIAEAEASR